MLCSVTTVTGVSAGLSQICDGCSLLSSCLYVLLVGLFTKAAETGLVVAAQGW